MKRWLMPVLRWLNAFGFVPLRFLNACKGLPAAVSDYRRYRAHARTLEASPPLAFSYPALADRFDASGEASGAYFHQDLHVARRIFQRAPARHIDVGSRVDGFVAHVASFREIDVLDIRPQTSRVPGVRFHQADLLDLPDEWRGACESVSSLHAIEHVGLGRYGDTVDAVGHSRAFDALVSMLAEEGILYVSVPIGRERVEFNSHRVISVGTVLGWAKGRLHLEAFSYVDDAGDLHADVPRPEVDATDSFGLDCGCGIFEFRRA